MAILTRSFIDENGMKSFLNTQKLTLGEISGPYKNSSGWLYVFYEDGGVDLDRVEVRAAAALTTSYVNATQVDVGSAATLDFQVKVTDITGITSVEVKVETALDAAGAEWIEIGVDPISVGVTNLDAYTIQVPTVAVQSYLFRTLAIGRYMRAKIKANAGGGSATVYAMRRTQ